jgi:hypothetical protein
MIFSQFAQHIAYLDIFMAPFRTYISTYENSHDYLSGSLFIVFGRIC